MDAVCECGTQAKGCGIQLSLLSVSVDSSRPHSYALKNTGSKLSDALSNVSLDYIWQLADLRVRDLLMQMSPTW